jgi:fluoride exporter
VRNLLLVCVGGALGSGARYLVATWSLATFGPDFPRGTLIVNVGGSFLLAVIMTASLVSESIPPEVRLFLGSGIMGGFTTYSSFNWETLALAQQGQPFLATMNLGLTLVGCLGAGLLGMLLVHWLAG